ncbi:hypothetical protein D3C81_2113790 [compost metagenome]
MPLAAEKRIALLQQHPLLKLGLWGAAQTEAERGSFLQQCAGHIRAAQHIDLELHLRVLKVKLREELIVAA